MKIRSLFGTGGEQTWTLHYLNLSLQILYQSQQQKIAKSIAAKSTCTYHIEYFIKNDWNEVFLLSLVYYFLYSLSEFIQIMVHNFLSSQECLRLRRLVQKTEQPNPCSQHLVLLLSIFPVALKYRSRGQPGCIQNTEGRQQRTVALIPHSWPSELWMRGQTEDLGCCCNCSPVFLIHCQGLKIRYSMSYCS